MGSTDCLQSTPEPIAGETFLSATLDALALQLAVVDEAGVILRVNRAWLDFCHRNQGDPLAVGVGVNYLSVCDAATGKDADHARRFVDGMRSVMSQAADEFVLEYPCDSPSEQRWFVARVTRFQEQGRARLVLAHEDVTQRRLAENEVLRLNADLERRVIERTRELEEANAELEAFSYSISHDLRAPLRSIEGFSRILEGEHAAEFGAEGRRYLGLVRAGARRMGELVEHLLEFARLSRQPVTRRTVDMNALVEQCVERVRDTWRERTVELVIEPLPDCEADVSLLKQVVLNLVDNAFKYTGRTPNPRVVIGSERGDGVDVYFVRDNGVGFDPERSARLFGVFQRLHHQEDFPGTGVGLAVVQRIVKRHGGKVWAKAIPETGATFYFTLDGTSP